MNRRCIRGTRRWTVTCGGALLGHRNSGRAARNRPRRRRSREKVEVTGSHTSCGTDTEGPLPVQVIMERRRGHCARRLDQTAGQVLSTRVRPTPLFVFQRLQRSAGPWAPGTGEGTRRGEPARHRQSIHPCPSERPDGLPTTLSVPFRSTSRPSRCPQSERIEILKDGASSILRHGCGGPA
jgi:hypothetical protein